MNDKRNWIAPKLMLLLETDGKTLPWHEEIDNLTMPINTFEAEAEGFDWPHDAYVGSALGS